MVTPLNFLVYHHMVTLYEKLHPVSLYSVLGNENLGPCDGLVFPPFARVCVCIEQEGGGGAVPADALCFNRLLSCVFTSFILLRHSRSNNLKSPVGSSLKQDILDKRT